MLLIKRKTREYVREILISTGTQAGEQVSIGRTKPEWIENLPAIAIYPANEAVQRFNEAPKDYRREFSLAIECLAVGNDDDDLDLALEEMGERVENIMEVDETLGGLVDQIELRSVEYQTEPDGQSPSGALILNYAVLYYRNANQPGMGCLEDLKRMDLSWEVGHHGESSDDVEDAKDQIDF